MKLIMTTTHYDYFAGGSREETMVFDSLMEGWKAYKEERKHDFDYGDAFHSTRCHGSAVYPAVLKPQRPHAREEWQWEILQEERALWNAMATEQDPNQMEKDAIEESLGFAIFSLPVEAFGIGGMHELSEEEAEELFKDLNDGLPF